MRSRFLTMMIAVMLVFAVAALAQEVAPQPVIVQCDRVGWAFVDAETTAVDDPCATEIEAIRTKLSERLVTLVDASFDAAYPFFAMGYEGIDPFGGTHAKGEYLGLVSSGDIDFLNWDVVSDIEIRLYGNAAVARYQSQFNIVVSGEETPFHLWHTDLYEKIDGMWKLVWGQDTRIEP